MWLSRSLIFLSVAVAAPFVRAFELEPRQHDGLSTCAQSCHDFLLPMFNCDSTTKLCFCVEASLTAVIDACVASNCTYAEQLESQEFQAAACEIPRRNQSGTINTLSWTMFSVATLFFLLRLASRGIARDGLCSGEWTILACYLCMVGATLCVHLSAKNGLGQDSWYFSVDQISDFLRTFYAFTIVEHTILLLTKLSLVSIYLCILPRESLSTAYRSICWTFISLLLITYLATQLATVLQCTPISSTWNFVLPNERQSKCLDTSTLIRAFSALNLVYDMILLFLPIPVLLVASKRMDAVQKSGVYLSVVLGTGVIICSVGRLVVVPLSTTTTTSNASSEPTTTTTTPNMTWTLAQPTLWTILQLNLGVILICIPALHPLVSLFYHNRKSSGASLFSSTTSAREILDDDEKEDNQQRTPRRASTRRPGTMTSSFSSHHGGGGGGFDFEGGTITGPSSRGRDEDEMSSSPALHVGLGEGSVTLQHGIPMGGPTRDRFVYRDGEGRMHEVVVVDRPASGSAEEGKSTRRTGEEGN